MQRENDRLMTIREVAERLHVSRHTLYTWSSEKKPGQLLGFKMLGGLRYWESDVDKWLDDRQAESTGGGAA